MGKGGKAPEAPDAYETASAEAQFNRLDTYSPSGSGTRYGYTDAKGNFVQGVAPQGSQSAVQTVESQWEKAIREALQPASTSLVNRMVSDNVTNMPGAARPKDTSALAQQIFDAGYARMAPQFEQENNRILTNLQARGIPVGAEAFSEASAAQQQQVNDAMQQLTLGAQEQAAGEQSRQFALDSATRQNSISEIVAAMGGSYNPPNASASGNAAGVNYSGLVGQQYQNELGRYNAQQQQKAQTAGAIGSIGAGLLMKCSRDFKNVGPEINDGDNGPVISIADLSDAVCQMPLHVWAYRPDHAPAGDGEVTHIGPMAEDFHRLTGIGDAKTISVIDAFGVVFGALKDALTRVAVLERRMGGEAVH